MTVTQKNLTKILSTLTPMANPPPLVERVRHRFTVGFWNHKLIDRSTFKGRFTHSVHNLGLSKTLRKWTHGDDPDKRLVRIVNKTIKSITRAQLNALPPTQQKEICDYKYQDSKQRAQLDPTLEQGVQQLIHLLQDDESHPIAEAAIPHWSKDSKQLSELSLLPAKETAPVKNMTMPLLNTLFGNGTVYSETPLSKVFDYVAESMSKEHADLIDPLKRVLKQATDTDSTLKTHIKQQKNHLSGSRSIDAAKLKEMSKAAEERVRNLKSGESYVVFGGTHARLPNLQTLGLGENDTVSKVLNYLEGGENLDHLTDVICDVVLPEIGQMSKGLVLEENQGMLDHLIRGDIVQHLFPRLTHSLFEGRSLAAKAVLAPAELARRGVEKVFNSYAKQASDAVAEWVIGLVASHSQELFQELHEAYQTNKLDETVRTKLKHLLTTHTDKLRQSLSDKFQEITSLLPAPLLEIMQSNNILEIGAPEQPIWFEFVGQSHAKYTLNIYAAGSAATLHPLEERDGHILYQVPLTIPDRSIDDFDASFFTRLFAYKAWPAWYPGVNYRPSDIYKWIKEIFEVKEAKGKRGYGTEAHKEQGPWAVFQLWLSNALQFQTEQEEKLFYFNVRKQALLDVWTRVRPNLTHDVNGREIIRNHAKKLSLEALELFKKGWIDLALLQRICATRLEIDNLIDEIEVRTDKIADASGFIPPNVLPHLKKLFTTINLSRAEKIKDLLIGAIGDEFEPKIDAFIETIIPKKARPKLQSAPPLTGLQRFKKLCDFTSRAILGLRLQDFHKFSFEGLFRLAILATRVALSILYPQYALYINAGFTTVIVANSIFSTVINRAFSHQIARIHKWKRRALARYLAKSLLGPAQLKHFNAVIDSWAACAVRSGKISYTISSLPIKNKHFVCKLATSKVKPPRMPKISEGNKVFPEVLPKYQPYRQKVDVSNVHEVVNQLVALCEDANESDNDAVSRFLNAQLKNLPIPTQCQDCWSQVANPQVVIRELATTMLHLFQATQGSQHNFEQHRNEVVVNFYRCYAIIDKLVRRCPEAQMAEFGVNPWSLAFWSRNVDFRQFDLDTRNALKQIKLYFEIDPNREYTDKEIKLLAEKRKCLFYDSKYHHYSEDSINQAITNISVQINADNCGSPFEKQYYKKLLSDPTVKEKLRLHQVDLRDPLNGLLALYLDPPLQEEVAKSLDQKELAIFGDDPRRGILPPPFAYLRLANGLVHTALDRFVRFPNTDLPKLEWDLKENNMAIKNRDNDLREFLHLISGRSRFKRDNDASLKKASTYKSMPFHHAQVENPLSHNNTRRSQFMPEGNNIRLQRRYARMKGYENGYKESIKANTTVTRILTNALHSPRRAQTEVINAPPTFTQLQSRKKRLEVSSPKAPLPPFSLANLSQPKRQLIEMLWEEKSDQAVRALSFFSQNIHLLFQGDDATDYLMLFETLIFSEDVLYRQLETEKGFAKVLGEFFAKALTPARIAKYPEICLNLIERGILAQAEVRLVLKDIPNFNPDAGFPSFREILHGMLPHSKNHVIAGLLTLPYYFIDPAEAPIATQRHAIEDICTAILDTKKSYKFPNVPRGHLKGQDADLYGMYCYTMAAWEPVVGAALNTNAGLRKNVLSRLANRSGQLPADQSVAWAGEYPYFQSATGQSLQFTHASTPPPAVNDAAIRDKITSELTTIFGRKHESELTQRAGKYCLESEHITISTSELPRDDDDDSQLPDQQLVFAKTYKDQTYYWVTPKDAGGDPHTTYWITPTADNGAYHLLILYKGKFKELKRVKANDGVVLPTIGPDARPVRLNLDMLPTIHTSNGEVSERVDLTQVPHELGFLTWFQPTKHINVFRSSRNPTAITRIEFSNLDLAFNIKKQHGELQAVSEERYPNFRIAKDQRPADTFPVLQQHTRYLLLENPDSGEHRVILPADTHYAAGITWLIKELGILNLPPGKTLWLESLLNQIVQQMPTGDLLKGPALYDYSIDEQGHLYSTDPMAILHLLLFSFAKECSVRSRQRSMDDTVHYLELLELRGNLANRLPDNVLALCQAIECMAPFSNNPEMIALALRLSALRQRNTLVNQAEKPSQMESRDLQALSTVFTYASFHMSTSAPTRFVNLRLKPSHKKFLNDATEDFAETYLLNLLEVSEDSTLSKFVKPLGKKIVLKLFSLVSDALDPSSSQHQPELEKTLPILSHAFSSQMEIRKHLETKIAMDMDQLQVGADWKTIPIGFDELTSENLTSYFHVYYRLARDKAPPSASKADKKEFHVRAAAFRRSLQCLFGNNFDATMNTLITCLRAASHLVSWIPCPNPDSFDQQLMAVEEARAKLSEVDKSKEREKYASTVEVLELAIKERNSLFLAIKEGCVVSMAYQETRISEILFPCLSLFLPNFISGFSKTKKISPPALPPRKPRALLNKATALDLNQADPLRNWLQDLEQEDTQYENICTRLLKDNFAPSADGPAQKAVQRVASFGTNHTDPSVQHEYRRFNTDLADYYKVNEQRPETTYTLKGREHLYVLQTQLRDGQQALKGSIQQHRQHLVHACQSRVTEDLPDEELVVMLMQDRISHAYAGKEESFIQGLIQAFARGDEEWVKTHTSLKDPNEIAVTRKISRYLIKSTRLHQMDRALNLIAKIILLPLEHPDAQTYLKELTFELSRKRSYALDGITQKLTRELLVMEHAKKIMLWEKQPRLFSKILHTPHRILIWQGGTGMGKTDIGSVLVSVHQADGEQAPSHTFPDALEPENSEQTAMNAYSVYGMFTNNMHFSRRNPPKVRNLKAIYNVHEYGLLQREILTGCKNDALCLRALFVETALDLGKKFNDKTADLFTHFARPLQFMNLKTIANCDEPHRVLRLNEELIHPIGQAVSSEYVFDVISTSLVHLLVTHPTLDNLLHICENRQHQCSPKTYNDRIKPILAEFMSHNPNFEVADEHIPFLMEYLMGDIENLPAWLERHPWLTSNPHFEEINSALGDIRDIIANVIPERCFVGYGPSHKADRKMMVPYIAKDIPDENATIKHPGAARIKTLFGYLSSEKRLAWDETVDLIEYLQKKARGEMRLHNCTMDETPAARLFEKWSNNFMPLSSCDALDKLTPNAQQLLRAQINKEHAAVLLYVREFVLHTNKTYKESVFNNSHNFISMTKTKGMRAGTATVASVQGVLPSDAVVEPDIGTMGEFVNFVCKTCGSPEDELKEAESKEVDAKTVAATYDLKRPTDAPPPIIVEKDAAPAELLKSMVQKHFTPKSKLSTIIDAGALFYGLSNEKAAAVILENLPKHKKGVLFVSSTTHEKMVWARGSAKPQPLKTSTLKIDECLIFIDPDHMVGLNIIQMAGAGAFVTMSLTLGFDDWLQACRRMRGLANLGQFLSFFLLESTQQVISGAQMPTVRDLVHCTLTFQGKGQAERNYQAVLMEMADLISSTVLQMATGRPEEAAEGAKLITSFKEFFVQETDLSPTKMYARSMKTVDTSLALQHVREAYISKLKSSSHFTKDQITEITHKLEKIGHDRLLPTQVKVFVDGKQLKPYMTDLNLIQKLFEALNVNENLNTQQEERQDINLHENLNLQRVTIRCKEPKETLRKDVPWDPTPDYFSNLDWLRIQNVRDKTKHKSVHFFNVSDVLAKAKDPETREVAKAFTGNLWCTNNFIGILDGIFSDDLAEPVSKYQKPIQELLMTQQIDAQGRTTTTFGAISAAEAAAWRERMERDRTNNPRLKIGLFDIGLNTVVASGANAMMDDDLLHNPNILMDLARFKFLAGLMMITIKRPNYQEHDVELLQRCVQWLENNNLDAMKSLFRDIRNNLEPTADEGDLEFLFAKKKFHDSLMEI